MTNLNKIFVNTNDENLKNNENRTALLRIDSSSVLACLEFMLSKKISFEVDFTMESNLFANSIVHLEDQADKSDFSKVKKNVISSDLQAFQCILDKYINNFPIDVIPKVDVVANDFSISPSKLKRMFKERYGQTFYQVLLKARMDKSAELLKQGYKARHVSQYVGYGLNSDIKFNKMFQRHFGMTPKAYQKKGV